MRILSSLLLALILALGMPVAVFSSEVGNGCPLQAGLDDDAGNPCNPSGNGNDMACGVIGGACQVSAVLVADTVAPVESTAAAHSLLASRYYLPPHLLGLFRPPITRVN